MARPSLQTAQQNYPHRYTMEHIPLYARTQCRNGKYYAPQFRTDAEWYAATRFPGEKGIPRDQDHCETGPATWPLGQWLDKPAPAYPAPHMWKGY